MLSKAGREARLRDIEDALLAHEWRQQTVDLREERILREKEQHQRRKIELEEMRAFVEMQKRNKALSIQRYEKVVSALQ